MAPSCPAKPRPDHACATCSEQLQQLSTYCGVAILDSLFSVALSYSREV
jgi:hypothetical protein